MSLARSLFLVVVALLSTLVSANLAHCADATKGVRPNILVILADDLGYADVGFHGCKDIATPNLDALAASGVRCTSGYVTHPFCSPTRAGLLTGRYQQRFGHEFNPAYVPDDATVGLPTSQVTIADVLRGAGYATGCVGKWHLGAHPSFHPNRRGFDEYFGFLGGGHVYLAGEKGGPEYQIPLDRNGKPEPLEGYMTEVLGGEAAKFIDKHRGSPWFLYLAFNSPHTPLQVTEALAKRAKHIDNPMRRDYAGLIYGMDDAVGLVREALRRSGQEENTLVFFFSDNGGPPWANHSDNSPLSGTKGTVLEGGVRVPFVVRWPKQIPAGSTFDEPVCSLDVFATAASLSGAEVPESHKLDGLNIMPALSGKTASLDRKNLFWRTGGGAAFAVRQGKYKLVRLEKQGEQLFDLDADVGETKDIAAQHPETLSELRAALNAWNAELITPVFDGSKRQRKRAGAATTKNE